MRTRRFRITDVAHIGACVVVLLECWSGAPVSCVCSMLLLVLILISPPQVLGYLCLLAIVFLKLLLKELV